MEPSKSNGAKFSTHASWWIKATIRQALNTKSRTIRVPAHKTHIPDVGPKVSELDATYQGTYQPHIEKSHDESHLNHTIAGLLTKLKPKTTRNH